MSLPRIHEKKLIHFVTNRTEHAMFLLRPTKKTNELIKFWLARTLTIYGPDIKMYAFCFMSNHMHMLLRDPKGQLPKFMEQFKGCLARAINRELKRTGRFWDRVYDDVIVDGVNEFWDRYNYTTLNAVSSNLVANGADWKGISSYNYALNHTPVVGKGLDRNKHTQANRSKKKVGKRKFQLRFQFKLATPPMILHQSKKEQTRFLLEQFEGATKEYRKKHNHRSPLGMANVLKAHPLASPDNPKKSPRFKFFSFCQRRKQELEQTYRKFVDEYKACTRIWRQKFEEGKSALALISDLDWPVGSYPPTMHRPVGA